MTTEFMLAGYESLFTLGLAVLVAFVIYLLVSDHELD